MNPECRTDPTLVKVRILGESESCRQVLDQLRAAVRVVHVDGPYINRRAPGVRLYAYVNPTTTDALPESGPSGNVASVSV